MDEQEHKCRECGKVDSTVTFAPDSYNDEIYDDNTPVWECENCRMESLMDI